MQVDRGCERCNFTEWIWVEDGDCVAHVPCDCYEDRIEQGLDAAAQSRLNRRRAFMGILAGHLLAACVLLPPVAIGIGMLTSHPCPDKPWQPPATSTDYSPDMDADCDVDFDDLIRMLSFWGQCPEDCCCRADLNRDGVVDYGDLVRILDAMSMESE